MSAQKPDVVSTFALALAFIGTFGLVSCSSHLKGPRKAAADLEGSAAVGMSFVDFLSKLQSLSGAIALAKEEGASEMELRPYAEALEVYMSIQALWKQKIDCPSAFGQGDPNSCQTERIFREVRDLTLKYKVPFDKYDEASISAYEKEVNTYEKRLQRLQERGLDAYEQGVFRPWPGALQRANADVFESLLSEMWRNAARKAKQ